MNVAMLIAELQKLDGNLPVRITVGCAHETVLATQGEVDVRVRDDEVRLDGWASNTRIIVERNDVDEDDDE